VRSSHPDRRRGSTASGTTSEDEHDGEARQQDRSARRRTQAQDEATQASHEEISERAYFIYLEEGECDQFGNWLRAERELTAA
jgi:hypothetical protein